MKIKVISIEAVCKTIVMFSIDDFVAKRNKHSRHCAGACLCVQLSYSGSLYYWEQLKSL
jgi:hypothetical protein